MVPRRGLATRAQIRAINHRDSGCPFPGCHSPSAWNDTHHTDGWTLHLDPDGWTRWTRPDGHTFWGHNTNNTTQDPPHPTPERRAVPGGNDRAFCATVMGDQPAGARLQRRRLPRRGGIT